MGIGTLKDAKNMKTAISKIALISLIVTSFATAEDTPVVVSYDGSIEVKTLQSGMYYVLNRKYGLKEVPKSLLLKDITVVSGGELKPIKASVPAATDLYIGIDSGIKHDGGAGVKEYTKKIEEDGWIRFERISVTDERMRYLTIYKKSFANKTDISFLGVGFPGIVIIANKITVTK